MELELPRIASEQLAGFFLALARVSPLFALAPVFSARAFPAQVRVVAAFAIAVALTPIAVRSHDVPTDALELAGILLKEVLVGTAFAFSLSALVAALQVGAGVIDTAIGFSFAQIVDPFSSVQGAVLGQVYGLFAAIVIVITGGDQIMIMGLAHTYDIVPLTSLPPITSFGQLAVDVFGRVFVVGLEIVAPVLIAVVVVDAALGVVARAAPQMNVFVVGLPAKILTALAVIAATLPFVANLVTSELERSVTQALSILGAR
jgi:flagellar biosynthesis protein FliR